MTLVEAFEQLFERTGRAFSQNRVFGRARELAYGFITAWGRRTVSRALCAIHAQFEDWSASYRFFSRSPWEPAEVFQPVLETAVAMLPASGPIPVAMDDTTVKKSGKRIPGVAYARDPMSPPFHPNLIMGQRFIQAAVILRPEGLNGPARTIPVRFHPAPPARKPGKKASDEEWQAYRQAQKTHNLSCQGLRVIKDVRASLDQAGCQDPVLVTAATATALSCAACRAGSTSSHALGATSPCTYRLLLNNSPVGGGDELPKPKEIRTSDEYPWQEARIFGAGRLHDLRYKVVSNVLWKSGSRARPLRLIIIAPLRYRPTKKSRLLYREPAYLLTTDLTSPVETLVQAYFDRWEIEVNHRDEKSLFGVGDAQVWSKQAATRVPQFQVAVYAMLLLASLMAYGAKRTDHYLPLPKWRKDEERRPSILDIIALFREELMAEGVSAIRRVEQSPGGRQASRLRRVPNAS